MPGLGRRRALSKRMSDGSPVLRVIPAVSFVCAGMAIIAVMDLSMLVEEIDAEIHRLESVRALLTGKTAPLKRGAPRPALRAVSAESRARMAEAQKKRWAKVHKQQKPQPSPR
jgi:hypothetical protein